MQRRTVLQSLAGLGALSLWGCGNDADSPDFASTGPASGAGTSTVTGTIDPALLGPGAEVLTSRAQVQLTGNSFTTAISPTHVGLLTLADSLGLRGFALTFPGEAPRFDAENSALACLFLEEGFGLIEVGPARDLVARARASAAFGPLVALLAGGVPLDQLDGIGPVLDALVESLGSTFPVPSEPSLAESARGLLVSNPSPRFLDLSQGLLVAPDSSAVVAPGGAWDFHSLGPAATLPGDTSRVENTYLPTVFFHMLRPLLALVIGFPVSAEQSQFWLTQTDISGIAGLDPLVDLASDAALARKLTISFATTGSIGEVAENIRETFANLGRLITAIAYIAGLLYSYQWIIKYKKHKSDPNQQPIGTPTFPPQSVSFLAAALLALPSHGSVTSK